MSIFEHQRFEIWNSAQHPFKHPASDYSYTHIALPSVTNIESALNWILAVLYPQSKAAVATPAALPLVGNTLNDMRVVSNDGDGKAASYRWEQREGDASAKWYKIYDLDWGADSILSKFKLDTQDMYVYKHGLDDLDYTGTAVTGLYAGQVIYGGNSAGTNLTLRANSGDGTGARTGYVQVDDQFRPTVNNTFDLGTSSNKFKDAYIFANGYISTMTITGGSITDSSGAISFNDENLTTTGTIQTNGGLKDANVTTAIHIGDGVNNAFLGNTIDLTSSFVGAINQIQYSLYYANNTGFSAWIGAGAYYSVAGSDFTLLRGGSGFIRSKKINWAGGQTVLGLTAHATTYIYIDGTGTIGSSTTYLDSLFSNYIVLFEVLYDGTNVIVVKENHEYSENTELSRYLHNNVGPVIRSTGAIITRVATGTGGAAGDRQIKIVGADVYEDHGLETTIPGSAGAGVTWNIYYTNGSGQWTRYLQQTELPGFWNSAGTPTALSSGGATSYTVYTLYICKDDLNSSTPTYYAVMNTAAYSNLSTTNTAINNGTTARATTYLAELELAQLGYAIVQKTAGAAVYINSLIVSKYTFNSKLVGGGNIGSASLVALSVANFDGWLSATDTTVQVALDTIDDLKFYLPVDNLLLDGNTISSTNTNGNIILDPNGIGLLEFGSAIYPTTDSSWDIGKSGNVWNDLWIDGNLRDGTNTISIATLMSLSSAIVGPPNNGDVLFYNSGTGKWTPSAPDTEITHSALTGLTTTDAGHTQFAMLAGRAGGQTIQGDTAASGNLILESTAHGTKGSVKTKDNFFAFTNAAYALGSWSGIDIGGASNYFLNVYTKGEHFGLRLQNVTTATLPTAATENKGRLVFNTDTNDILVDTGTILAIVGASRHCADYTNAVFTGAVTTVNIDVSADITDARKCVIQLLDNANDFERVNCTIKATSASNVRIVTNVPLPAGTYRLICLE